MNRLKNRFPEKPGRYFTKVGEALKFIGMMEILFAIVIGAKYALSNDVHLTVAMISGFLFLIGMITAYIGVLYLEAVRLRTKIDNQLKSR